MKTIAILSELHTLEVLGIVGLVVGLSIAALLYVDGYWSFDRAKERNKENNLK